MNTLTRFAALMLLVSTVFITCKQTTTQVPIPTPPIVVAPQPQLVPSITRISPDKAVAGSSLTVTGENLQNATEVKFDGQRVSLVNSTNNTPTSLTVLVPVFTIPLSKTVGVGLTVSTSGGTSNSLVITVAPQAEITQSPVPKGLIPGGPLTLTVSNVSPLTGVDFMNDKSEITATVPVSSFLASNSGSIMLKVPVGVSAGWIRINTEYGHGKRCDIGKLYGSDAITASNVATSVGAMTTGSVSNASCLLYYSSYCVPLPDSSRKAFAFVDYPRSQSISQNCPQSAFHSIVKKGSHRYDKLIGQVRTDYSFAILQNPTNPSITLELEIKSNDTAIANAYIYTGSVMIEIEYTTKYKNYKDTYVGSMLDNYDLYVYSVTTGKGMLICRQGNLQVGINGHPVDCTACK